MMFVYSLAARSTHLRITLDVEDIQEGEPLIFAFIVENQLMRPKSPKVICKLICVFFFRKNQRITLRSAQRREWAKRKADGLNYKDKQQLGIIFADHQGFQSLLQRLNRLYHAHDAST